MSDLLKVTEEMKSVFHLAYKDNPENLPGAIGALKNAGYFQIAAILTLMSELKISLREATEILDKPDVWR